MAIKKNQNLPVDTMLRALWLIKKNNIFCFDYIHWIQLKVRDTGTPPAPKYATVFYGVFELFLLRRFGNNLLLYRRFIDNVLVLWKKYDEKLDTAELWAFQETMQEWYGLEWDFQGPFLNMYFMGLTIAI